MKLAQILERIENARTGEAVKLIAVSKNVTTKEVLELFRQGQTSFGENRVQALKNAISGHEIESASLTGMFGVLDKTKTRLELPPMRYWGRYSRREYRV